jgi:hypothetical protein
MRTSFLLAAAIVFGGLVYAGADGYQHYKEPDLKAVERALQSLSKGERAGFEILVSQFPRKTGDAKLLNSQAELICGHVESLGKSCGFELVGAEEVGRSLRRYTYLCKYEEGRIRWQFNFYRPNDEWKLEGYHFDTDDNALFFEAGHKLPIFGDSGSIAGRPQNYCN